MMSLFRTDANPSVIPAKVGIQFVRSERSEPQAPNSRCVLGFAAVHPNLRDFAASRSGAGREVRTLIWRSIWIITLLILLPVVKAAPFYQEIGWEALIPDTERVRNTDAFLKQSIVSGQRYRQDASHANLALQDKSVTLRGFVVPLERMDGGALREFLLVPFFGACTHVPPPPANQIIHVHANLVATDIQTMTPVTVYGSISLDSSVTSEGVAAYRLMADRVETGNSGNAITLPVLLTLLSGLSVGIGALAAFLVPGTHTRGICLLLGFSAGVMLWLGASPMFRLDFVWQVPFWFMAGVLLAGTLEYLLRRRESDGKGQICSCGQRHTGVFSALAVAAHGFPESLAVFSAALVNPATGMVLCGAVMAHHLPLGLSIALPQANRKSVSYAFFAGLVPATAIILLYSIIKPFFSPTNLGLFFSFAGGIMVFIAVMKLIPAARSHGSLQTLSVGLILGLLFAFSVFSLLFA
ncbi:MAG: DUF3299 domain-containing protein [Betaproteobacteria bacterium]|nr:DUF3299 domain-containing protein [Betaproteobacteria bacterium]